MRQAGKFGERLEGAEPTMRRLRAPAVAFFAVLIASSTSALGSGAVYHFDEGAGATAVDSSGAGNDGTIDGAYFVPGPSGTALRFADASHRVLLPESLFSGYLNTFYFEAWVRPDGTEPPDCGEQVIFQKRSPYNDWSIWMKSPENVLTSTVYDSTHAGGVSPTGGVLPANTWSKVAFWYDGGVARLYIDDVEVAQEARVMTLDWNTGYVQAEIGNNTYDAGVNCVERSFHGDIDEVIIAETKPGTQHNGTVFVTGGSLAGQALSASAWEITVSPNQSITGSIDVQTNNLMNASAVAPLGYTWTWGNRQTSIASVSGSIATGISDHSVTFNGTAPSTPGTYYILFGFNGEFDISQVLSCTNWTVTNPVWNDGNDYFDVTLAQLTAAHSAGYVANWTYLGGSGILPADIPLAPIKVTVRPVTGSCSGPYDLIIPAAAHSNGQWQSDVDVLNDGTGDAAVDIALLKQGQANPNPAVYTVSVPPGQAVRLVDILGSLLPATNAALGVRFCQGEPAVNSRFYNIFGKGGGTYGMWVPALPETDAVTPGARGTFHLLSYSTSSTSGFRVNIGLANALGSTAVVVTRLYGDDGLQIGNAITRTLRGFEQAQYTKIHQIVSAGPVAHGWATVEVTTPGAKVHAYAMLIDNASSAPLFMPVELR